MIAKPPEGKVFPEAHPARHIMDKTMTERPTVIQGRGRCDDCLSCQDCPESRCRICRRGGAKRGPCELGPYLTHGEFVAWKRKKYGREEADP